ncbi:extracellular solute-binding protein [Actinophytocola sp.]|uniref:extracellular solute-binding protein n=1 Tax=Actinophytocola sp. TaxID=1872138 RepID=UPI0025C2270D|nr:extracellular solute-binding protein [Actinophytocola sp.]
MTVRLRGLCWDHPRCVRPMAAAAEAYRAVRPDVVVEWDARPLARFNDQPVWQVAGGFDLIFVDHPMTGAVAGRDALVPLDTVLDAGELDRVGALSVHGGAYTWGGHRWALGVDAACQVAAFRADRLGADEVPATWDDVLALAKSAPGSVALPLYPSDAICGLMSLSANASLAAGERPVWVHPHGAEMLVELARLVDPVCFDRNPPALLDAMAGESEIAYVPLVFGYANLSRPPLRFADVPGVDGRPRGAVLGGAGLGVFPDSRHVADAAAFAAWCMGTGVQRDVLLEAGGQPGNRLVWDDPTADEVAGGFLSATRRSIDEAYLRPRERWWPEFQRDGGRLLVRLLRDGAPPGRIVEELTGLAVRAEEARR